MPSTITNDTLITLSSQHDDSRVFSQPPSPAINSTQKQNYYHFSNITSPFSSTNVSTSPTTNSHQ